MTTYEIQLETDRNVRLLKDDNAKAARPFDGGHIFYAPESYPAKICAFDYGSPTYAPGDENRLYAMPISYPTEMMNYRELVVNDEAEWRKAARSYIAREF